MPTYDFQCKKCGHIFEMMQGITEKPKKKATCEQCQQITPVRRLIGSGSAVLFKGPGFYQTDYRSSNYKKDKKAETKNVSKQLEKGTANDSKF